MEEVTNKELLQKLIDLECTVDKLKVAITGDITNGDKIGLNGRVRKIEEWIENRKWMERTFLGAIIVQLVLFAWMAAQLIIEYKVKLAP